MPDYSEVVIKKMKETWPEMNWVVMDCLDMKDVNDNSFGEPSLCCKHFIKSGAI